ncbi:hypothetical protein MUP51_05745 [Candidatus Bathyarchaeota archaeon]|nr:hypothetical protein [Candidatus Bathyarchaeota archaeon]MCJ7731802.1 hypothetical protein [Candidatus Bathyarchaeota archaeon]
MSYIFYCNNQTMDECFKKALFGNTYKHWETIKKIKKGALIFLINLSTGILYGPFTATRKSQLNLDPYAFLSSGRNYPAQVEVQWRRLMKMERPYSKLPFLDGQRCRLKPSETVQLMSKLIEEDSRLIHRWA